MKKALLKDSFKEIRNTYKRFISILLMAFLGVGFFAGIRATSPDMIDTIDQYYTEQQVYDIEVLSTLGLTKEDLEALKQIEGVEEVYGYHSQDGLLKIEDTEFVAKVMELASVNVPKLLEGRMPQEKQECLVENGFCTRANKQIGDWIEIKVSNEENNSIQETKMQIVGIMQSPLYISRDKGTSQLGSGRVDYLIYTPSENIDASFYTSIYITIQQDEKLQTGSKAYEDKIEEVRKQIKQIQEERQKARYEQIVGEATEELNKAKQELETQKQEAQEKLQEAQDTLDAGKQEIAKGEQALQENKQAMNKQFSAAEKQLQQAKNTISQQEQTLKTAQETAKTQIAQAQKAKEEQQKNLEKVKQGMQTAEKQYAEIEKQLENTTLTQEQKEALEKTKQTLQTQIKTLQAQKAQLEGAISQIEEQIQKANIELQTGEEQLQDAKTKITKQEQQLKSAKQTAQKEIQKASKQLEQAKVQITQGEQELAKNKQTYEDKIKEAEAKLLDAQNEIDKIEHPKWYILDRQSNTGYHSFMQDTKSIENIGTIFPLVFFIIATLISLTSMTRMVEEQRVQIGTLKALGYSKLQVALKYIIYASVACLVGGFLGMCVGFVLLPKIIWMMYSMMYTISDIYLSFNWYYAILGLGLASLCIIGATVYAAALALKDTPAQLMRPKSPKAGKRVLLERIPFIWKKLSFTKKVTVRNIFRYKKRFLMTIIGIAGCTSLILAGFGVKDAISAILPNQYEQVYHYDMQISLQNELEESSKQAILEKVLQKEEVNQIVETYMVAGTLQNEKKQEDVQIIVPQKVEELNTVIELKDVKTKQSVSLTNDKIIITDKVAQLLGVKKGDTILLKDSNQVEKTLEISDVVENYISHYVYMSKALYESIYGLYHTNVVFTQNQEITEEQEKALAKDLLKEEEITAISTTSNIKGLMDDMMNSLNYVVLILIVSAGLLAFVVLYNLSNVNISERIRELATIKVLGFYDKEVYSYVTRETVILTLIGTALGLLGGFCLNYFIIGTCEINMLRFTKTIQPISYVYAVVITLLFTIIVNIVTYFSLKKIDMIESLKSVE